MFNVNNNKVYFSHNTEKTELTNGQTLCRIIDLETGEILAQGTAFCSLKDNFNRNTGRKVSLKKALEKLNLTAEQRKIYWDMYFERRGGQYV